MTKPSIIILHGWGLSAKRFEPLTARFKSSGYPTYTPDFPGFGQSNMPERPLDLNDYADFLYEFIKRHHLTKPVLIGHSFGGRVSLKYNYLHPNSVRALILSGTPGFTPVSRKKIIMFVALAKIGKFIFSIPPLSLVKDAVRKWYYYVVGAKEFYRAQGVMRETFKNIVKEQLEIPMKANTAPTFLLWGEQDYITPTRIPKQMHALMPHAKILFVPNADHGLPFKKPDIFFKHAESFIQSL